jgi:hypothetical protein
MMGHFEKAGWNVARGGKVGKRVVREWRVSEDAVLPVGGWPAHPAWVGVLLGTR